MNGKLIGMRKIAVWAIATGLNFILIVGAWIEPEHWVELQIWITLAVIGGNAVTHIAQAVSGKRDNADH